MRPALVLVAALVAVQTAGLATAPAHAAFTAVTTTPEDGILNVDPAASDGRLTLTFSVDATGTVELSGDGITSQTIDIDDPENAYSIVIPANEIDIVNDFFDLTLTHDPDNGAEATTTVAIAVDATPPLPPSDVRTLAANGAVVLAWSGHIDFPPPFDTNVERYTIFYSAQPLTDQILLANVVDGVGDVADYSDTVSTRTIDFTDNTLIDGLRNGVTYYFAIEAIDHAGNRSGLSADADGRVVATTGVPVQTATLGELTGVDDRCFIATAALGHDSTWLDTYRAFRDRVLLRIPGGTTLVEAYYRHSPPAARWLAEHDGWRNLVRALLLAAAPGVALMAATGPAPWLAALLLCLGTAALLRWRKLRGAQMTALIAATATVSLLASPVAARDAYDPEQVITLHFGPWQPKRAQRLATNGRLLDYRDVYGPTGTYRIEVAYDWYPFAWGGRWGIGGRTGLAVDRGRALAQDQATGEFVRSGEDATFLFFPTSANLKYRGHWVKKQPLMPVVEAGFDFWPINENRDSRDDGMQNFVYGWHVGGELELSLNWIEPRSAYYMERNYGIHGTSLMAGYHYTRLDDFGAQRTWDFSQHNWTVGLRFLF